MPPFFKEGRLLSVGHQGYWHWSHWLLQAPCITVLAANVFVLVTQVNLIVMKSHTPPASVFYVGEWIRNSSENYYSGFCPPVSHAIQMFLVTEQLNSKVHRCAFIPAFVSVKQKKHGFMDVSCCLKRCCRCCSDSFVLLPQIFHQARPEEWAWAFIITWCVLCALPGCPLYSAPSLL